MATLSGRRHGSPAIYISPRTGHKCSSPVSGLYHAANRAWKKPAIQSNHYPELANIADGLSRNVERKLAEFTSVSEFARLKLRELTLHGSLAVRE